MVKAQWFELLTQSPRCYRLQKKERTLVVNEMIRLAGIKFDKVVKHSARLGGGAAEGSSLHYLGEDTHNCLGALVRDQKAEAENAAVVDISAQGS